MKNHELFLDELNNLVNRPEQETFDYLEENIACFFSTPFISEYYRIVRNIEVSRSKKVMPKLLKAWLAFLCGDNAGYMSVMAHFDELELKEAQGSSFYYSLKALVSITSDRKDKVKYAKLSVDVLPKEDTSIFMANAKLTYAQINAGTEEYRTAAGLFDEAYRMFYRLDMHFPAAVALVNKLMNRYKLGEFEEVIEECNKALYMSASFRNEFQDYWNIVHLPLGICYFEMNRPSLAIEHLAASKSCIDKLGLFHMHGLVELYLFKSYCIRKDKAGMEVVRDQALVDFKPMNYIYFDYLISLFCVLSSEQGKEQKLQPVIERLELEYEKSRENSNIILLETLAYLKLMGSSEAVTTTAIVKCIEKLKFIGAIPDLQLFLILLAEMYYQENNLKAASDTYKEALTIYQEYHIYAGFFLIPLKSVSLLKPLNRQLYDKLILENQKQSVPDYMLLSAREKEIMQLVVLGKSNEQISNELFISVGTIKWHLNQIFGKLEVENRIQASRKVKEFGILP